MWWNKNEDDEEGYNGVKPNVSHNYDSQLYDLDEYGNYLGRKSADGSSRSSAEKNETSGYTGNRKNSGSYTGSQEAPGSYSKGKGEYGSANGRMLDAYGREVPNRFGLKIFLSILALLSTGLLGMLAFVFTILQNGAYKRGDAKAFRNNRTISNIFLVLSLLFIMICIGAVAGFTAYIENDPENEQSAEEIVEKVLDGTYFDELFSGDSYSYSENYEDDYYDDVSSYVSAGDSIDVDGMYTITYQGQELTLGEPAGDRTEELELYDYNFADEFEDSDQVEYYLGGGAGTDLSAGEDGWDYLSFYNNTEEELPISECNLVQITLSTEYGATFSYMGSLNEQSSPEEFAAVLGDTYEFTSYGDGSMYFCWYTEDGGAINLWYQDGVMTEIQIYVSEYFEY